MRLSCLSGDRLSRRMNRLSTNRGNPGPPRLRKAKAHGWRGRASPRRPVRRAAAAGVRGPRAGVDLWAVLGSSVEGQFYSAADWQRGRWELWYASTVMTAGQGPSANMWTTIQRGLGELLVSPAAKRRAAIELQAAGPDPDEVAAVSMVGRYHSMLRPVD
jgi:hypothetical protein